MRPAQATSPDTGTSRFFRRYRIWIIVAWLLTLMLVSWLFLVGPQPTALPQTQAILPLSPALPASSAPFPEVTLPADDAAHHALTEWWYYNGHLRTRSGEQFSFHLASFLRQAALSHTIFHGSLLDHQHGKLYTEQARTAGNPSRQHRDGFDFSFGTWRLQGSDRQHSAAMVGKDFALEIQMQDPHPPIVHRARGGQVAGLLDFGAAGWSYYLSRPRMRAEGTVTIGGLRKAVSGEVWFDHQWGDFEAAQLRWNWFALQLVDNTELMLFELFDRQGDVALRMGTHIRDGQAVALADRDFITTRRGDWRSPATGILYPVRWAIALPPLNLHLQVDPVIPASEFDARTTTLNVYWEGAVRISGERDGVGYMELSGYPAQAGGTPLRNTPSK